MKTLTRTQMKILYILDLLLGMFHAYGFIWFHKNDVMIGKWLTVALMVAITVLDTWAIEEREKQGIYKPLKSSNARPIASSGETLAGSWERCAVFFAVDRAPILKQL